MRASVFAAIAALILAPSLVHAVGSAAPRPLSLRLAGSPSAAESLVQSQNRALFFERRLTRNPDDIDILNRLSALYLQRLRETGAFSDLDLAQRASHRSLAVVPPVRNVAGLTSRAMAEFASHEFVAARDDAKILVALDGSGTPYALLGDAYAELGDYRAAEGAYARLRTSLGDSDENVATRRARMALLKGNNDGAKTALSAALAIELERNEPSRERVAWYCWQLGDTSFFTGDYSAARARYDDSLEVYPEYFRARASSGRLDAAQGDYRRAITDYQLAIQALPDPTFVAELGDVYALSGDRISAQREYALVDFIGRLSVINGVMYNRQLVMFDADHDRKPAQAYRFAQREYRLRRDILGADAVAWTALKAGKIVQARAAMREALRLGTNDPRLLYHAGMIARASGDNATARAFLENALRLSPVFDPLQSRIARSALAGLMPRS
jgi:tetratricopeptide (TPR) repeat protein